MTACSDPLFAQSQPQTGSLVKTACSSQTLISVFHVPVFCQVPASATAPWVARGRAQSYRELGGALAAAGPAPSTAGEPGGVCCIALEMLPLHTRVATQIGLLYLCQAERLQRAVVWQE